jgi:hypothetical protein
MMDFEILPSVRNVIARNMSIATRASTFAVLNHRLQDIDPDLTERDYYCPRCNIYALKFLEAGLWD